MNLYESHVSGALSVSGSVSITDNLVITGSGFFGDTVSDNHRFTGSVLISGSLRIPTAVSTAAALGTTIGQIFYNTTDNLVYRYNGSTWATIGGGGGGTAVPGQIILTGAGGWPSITNGCQPPQLSQTATNLINFYYLGFPDTTQLFANWSMPMPSDYDGGTITAVFYWMAGSASTNGVRWGLAARSFADGDALDQAFGTVQEVTDANQANDDVNISAATPAITIGGTPAAGNYVHFRAYRDPANGADNLAATAELLSIRITYTRA